MPSDRLAVRDAAARVSAALIGTLPVALLAGVSLARFLPLTLEVRFALGFTLVLPVWVALMCVTFLARSAARAWALNLALAVPLALVVAWSMWMRH